MLSLLLAMPGAARVVPSPSRRSALRSGSTWRRRRCRECPSWAIGLAALIGADFRGTQGGTWPLSSRIRPESFM